MAVTLRAMVRNFDAWVRQGRGVFEFSQDPGCLLRIQLATARIELDLPDRVVSPGDAVLLLHLWNERLLQFPPHGPDLAWAKPMQRQFVHSLRMVATCLKESSELAQVSAVGGVTVLAGLGTENGGSRLLKRLGFKLIPYTHPLGTFGEFWENFYSWVLIWTYNPSALRYRSLWGLKRIEFWMSVRAFLERFGYIAYP